MQKELKEKIIALHLQYKSRGYIANELNISLISVISAVKSYYCKNVFGRKVVAKKLSFLDKNIKNIKKMAKKGCSLRKIAEEYGVSDATVHRFLKANNIKNRVRVADTKLGKEIIRLRKQKMTVSAISKQLGVSMRRVHYVICYAVSSQEIEIWEQKKPKQIEKDLLKKQLEQLKKGLKND